MMILKLILVPTIVALIAIIGRHWGAKVSGLLSGFPVIAGPIIYFIYKDQGSEFARVAATVAVGGVVALSSFCFAYSWSATKFNWVISLMFSLIVYVALAFLVVKIELNLFLFFLVSLVTIILQIYLSPRHSNVVGLTLASNSEIVTRMLCAAILVLSVTFFANAIGPQYSGVFAVFPIASTVIAVFSHKNHSAFHVMDSLKSLKFGLISLLLFFFTLALLIDRIGFDLSFCLSIVAAILIQFCIFFARTKVNFIVHQPSPIFPLK